MGEIYSQGRTNSAKVSCVFAEYIWGTARRLVYLSGASDGDSRRKEVGGLGKPTGPHWCDWGVFFVVPIQNPSKRHWSGGEYWLFSSPIQANFGPQPCILPELLEWVGPVGQSQQSRHEAVEAFVVWVKPQSALAEVSSYPDLQIVVKGPYLAHLWQHSSTAMAE